MRRCRATTATSTCSSSAADPRDAARRALPAPLATRARIRPTATARTCRPAFPRNGDCLRRSTRWSSPGSTRACCASSSRIRSAMAARRCRRSCTTWQTTRWCCGVGRPDSAASRCRSRTTSSCGRSRPGPPQAPLAGRRRRRAIPDKGPRSPCHGACDRGRAASGGIAHARVSAHILAGTAADDRPVPNAVRGIRMRQRRSHRLKPEFRRQADGRSPDGSETERRPLTPLFGERDTLLAKYEQLSKKYESLVQKYENASVEETGVYQLGWWALRTSASALALVREGACCLASHRWQELERGNGELGWELVAPDEPPRTHPTLHHLALAAAALMQAGSASPSRVARYRRLHGEQVIEMRAEAIASKHGIVALLAHDVTAQVRA